MNVCYAHDSSSKVKVSHGSKTSKWVKHIVSSLYPQRYAWRHFDFLCGTNVHIGKAVHILYSFFRSEVTFREKG